MTVYLGDKVSDCKRVLCTEMLLEHWLCSWSNGLTVHHYVQFHRKLQWSHDNRQWVSCHWCHIWPKHSAFLAPTSSSWCKNSWPLPHLLNHWGYWGPPMIDRPLHHLPHIHALSLHQLITLLLDSWPHIEIGWLALKIWGSHSWRCSCRWGPHLQCVCMSSCYW